MKPSKPLFLQRYALEGAVIEINSGSPVKERIVKEFLRSKFGENANLNLMAFAGFWIMEGTIQDMELDAAKFPSLYAYFANRDGSLDERWEHYENLVQEDELDLLRMAYDGTRRHVLETMADAPFDEKKSDSTKSSLMPEEVEAEPVKAT